MSKVDNTKKLLLISLDGLSVEQFRYLSSELNLKSLGSVGQPQQFSGGCLGSPQAVWGELLSGQKWFESGCAGYAYPKSNLNDLDIGSESSFAFQSILGNNIPSIIVNMPLMESRDTNRWLSDGSFSQDTVRPQHLRRKEPFKSYRSRPFSSAAYFWGNTKAGVVRCLETEKLRLSCALELIKEGNWQFCIVRLNVFEILNQLLGINYLQDETLAMRSELLSFLEFADNTLQEILQLSKDATTCVISAYCHDQCHKRVNLNLLLSHSGYCLLSEEKAVRASNASRQESLLSLSEEVDYKPSPLVCITNRFEFTSIAASPTYGTVYLNTKERFSSGIIDKEAVEYTKEEIGNYLIRCLQNGNLKEISMEANPQPNLNLQAPDILISAKGVAFHDLYSAPAVDNFSHPLSSFNASGFICSSSELTITQLDTIGVHNFLSSQVA